MLEAFAIQSTSYAHQGSTSWKIMSPPRQVHMYDPYENTTSALSSEVVTYVQRYVRPQTTAQNVSIATADPKARDTSGRNVIDELREIKDEMGLNLSQLSKVLGVSRPQLYKWLEGEVRPQREQVNRRIRMLSDLTKDLPEGHAKFFGKLVNRYVSERKSLMDVLSDPHLNAKDFSDAYAAISSDIELLQRKSSSSGNPASSVGPLLPPIKS